VHYLQVLYSTVLYCTVMFEPLRHIWRDFQGECASGHPRLLLPVSCFLQTWQPLAPNKCYASSAVEVFRYIDAVSTVCLFLLNSETDSFVTIEEGVWFMYQEQ